MGDELASKEDVQRVIDDNRTVLESIPGFVHAEPGFPLIDGRISTEPAIIVFVAAVPANDLTSDEARPPAANWPYPVVVMQADPRMQLSTIPGFFPAPTIDGQERSKHTYRPLEGNSIDQRFEVQKPMLCHISPDAGWPTLKDSSRPPGERSPSPCTTLTPPTSPRSSPRRCKSMAHKRS